MPLQGRAALGTYTSTGSGLLATIRRVTLEVLKEIFCHRPLY